VLPPAVASAKVVVHDGTISQPPEEMPLPQMHGPWAMAVTPCNHWAVKMIKTPLLVLVKDSGRKFCPRQQRCNYWPRPP